MVADENEFADAVWNGTEWVKGGPSANGSTGADEAGGEHADAEEVRARAARLIKERVFAEKALVDALWPKRWDEPTKFKPGQWSRLHLPSSTERELWEEARQLLAPLPDLGIIEGLAWEAPIEENRWLIRDVVPHPLDGGRVIIGGADKAFKTLFAITMAVSVASGKPFLGGAPGGAWSVPEDSVGKVLVFIGEGGEKFLRARFHRVADALGVGVPNESERADMWSRLVLVTRTPTATQFEGILRMQLERVEPLLTIIDPLYLFGGSTERQIGPMGELLSRWSAPCEEAGSTLGIVDHFRKSVTALELASLSGHGLSSWAQAWVLVRTAYASKEDRAVTLLKYGSRQSAGGEMKVVIGGVTDGAMSFEVGEPDPEMAAEVKRLDKVERVMEKVRKKCDPDPDGGDRAWLTDRDVRRMGRSLDRKDGKEGDALVRILTSDPRCGKVTTENSGKTWWFCPQLDDLGGDVPDLPDRADPDTLRKPREPEDWEVDLGLFGDEEEESD